MDVSTSLSFITVVLISLSLLFAEAEVGVSYGKIGNNLPSPQDVVNLYKSNGIKSMRLYFPDQATLQAIEGSGISVMLGVANENIQNIASCQCQADSWVRTNIIPFQSCIKYIVVGNEIEPSDQKASLVITAMKNLQNSLNSNNLSEKIKISTAINTDLIINSYPPSNGAFKNPSYITPIINCLNDNDSPLLVNVYPYFAYVNDPTHISLDYALLNKQVNEFIDPNNGLGYQNLFDAMVDSVYAAMRKVDGMTIMAENGARRRSRVVVSESGWSSKGGFGASLINAGTYYRNLANHVQQGTPLTKGQPIETYLFAMFDENQKKGAETERNFGLFTPTQQSKYGQINF